MLKCEEFFSLLKKYDLTFFSGIPDSTFKSFMSFLEKNKGKLRNIVTVNECEAVAVSAGYHLSTGKIAVVYLQNSGLGKTVNPLTSLCDPSVYSIPILFMIGWRGEPDKKDAYQHHKMGRITIDLLELLDIPYEIITDDIEKLDKIIRKAKKYMTESKKPYALIIKKNIFEKLNEKEEKGKKPTREEAIKTILKNLKGNEIIISTTGKTSRELFENRKDKNDCGHDFYNIGAMGCAQSIALGISLNKKDKDVFVFDGDGSVLMQMGALATTGHYCPKNYYHIVFDNKAHDSTGGQPTCSDTIDLKNVSKSCNYKYSKVVDNLKDLETEIKKIKSKKGPLMIVVKIRKGSRDNLGRPPLKPKEYKEKFMKYIQEN